MTHRLLLNTRAEFDALLAASASENKPFAVAFMSATCQASQEELPIWTAHAEGKGDPQWGYATDGRARPAYIIDVRNPEFAIEWEERVHEEETVCIDGKCQACGGDPSHVGGGRSRTV